MQAVEDLRDAQLVKVMPTGDTLTAWEMAALKGAAKAIQTIEAESSDPKSGSSSRPEDAAAQGKGDGTGISW